MTLRPSIIQAGNVSLRSFEDAGVHTHAAGIEQFYRFTNTNQLDANKSLAFSLPTDVQIMSVWILSTDELIETQSNINFGIGSDLAVTGYNVLLDGFNYRLNAQTIVWEPKFLILQSDNVFWIVPRFDTLYINVFAREVNVKQVINGQG